jgi:hypothetical protein
MFPDLPDELKLENAIRAVDLGHGKDLGISTAKSLHPRGYISGANQLCASSYDSSSNPVATFNACNCRKRVVITFASP